MLCQLLNIVGEYLLLLNLFPCKYHLILHCKLSYPLLKTDLQLN